jgi:hypothetical protein
MIEECSGTAVILDRDCYGITLSANVIAHHLEGGIDLRDALGCAVSANTLTDCGRKLPSGAAWIDLPEAADSQVKDNLEDR